MKNAFMPLGRTERSTPKHCVLKTRLNIGENGQSLLDGSLKVFWPVARSAKLRP